MTDIFSLVGRIIINSDDAKKSLNEVTDTAEKSSSSIGNALSKIGTVATKVGKTIAVGLSAGATAISYITKQAVDAYGNYEQLVGGVETLFGAQGMTLEKYAESVGKTTEEAREKYEALIEAQTNVFNNASEAWINQGLSANEYMETVTSFSASLINSLDKDTVKASELANTAITDMADNANKMGTDIASIQNAYQGFAKQNYTMLDNLKIGYGGTKTEMERLLSDAQKIKRANGEMVTYSIEKFSDMVEAIHVIQTEIGITGTTYDEAKKTIQGSLNALKGAWSNVLTGLADDTQDFDALLTNLVGSIETFASNIKPRIVTIFATLPTAIQKLVPQLTSLVEDLLPPLLQSTIQLITSLIGELPSLISTLASALWDILESTFGDFDVTAITAFMDNIGNGIREKIPVLLDTILPMLQSFSESFLENVPMLIESGMELIANIIQGLVDSLPQLIEYVPTIITNIADTISQSMEIILGKGIEIIWAIIKGLIEAIPDLIANFGDIIQMIISVWDAIQWLDLGKNLINGIKNGITALKDGFVDFVKNLFNNIKDFIKNIFNGVHSDSTSIWGKIFDGIKTVVSNIFNTIKSVFTNAWSTVKTIFNNIKTAIQNPIETARNLVKSAIDKMRSYFNFTWSLPHLKLPHVSISGSFSLVPPSVPHFSIDWYKNGGILTDPTIFGMGKNGNLLGGGEAGAEAVAPLDTLMDYVRVAVDESNSELAERLNGVLSILSDYLPQLTERQLILDTGVLVGELASPMDESLGTIQRRKDR